MDYDFLGGQYFGKETEVKWTFDASKLTEEQIKYLRIMKWLEVNGNRFSVRKKFIDEYEENGTKYIQIRAVVMSEYPEDEFDELLVQMGISEPQNALAALDGKTVDGRVRCEKKWK